MAGKRRVFAAAFKAKVALAAAKGDRTTAQLASHGIRTSQVTACKKQLMAHVGKLLADGRQRRAESDTYEQELYEQLGRLKMEVEWLEKAVEVGRSQAAMHRAQPRTTEPISPVTASRLGREHFVLRAARGVCREPAPP